MWVIAMKNSIQTYWPCHRVQLAYSFRLAPVHARMPSALWEGLKPGSEQAWLMLVQSLNPPFFLRHIGAEPGRAKRESRITCMHMLRTSHKKLRPLSMSREIPYHAVHVNVSRNAFFSSRSEKNVVWPWIIKRLDWKLVITWGVSGSLIGWYFGQDGRNIVEICDVKKWHKYSKIIRIRVQLEFIRIVFSAFFIGKL